MVDEEITIEPCGQFACVDVPIIDDMIVEGPEYFVVKLARDPSLDSRIKFKDTLADVTINDNDSMYVIVVIVVISAFNSLQELSLV